MKRVLLSMALCLGAAFFVANVNAQNKVAFVNVATSINDIFDEDEKAAANWFVTTYGGEYLPVSAITPAKLNEYKVLWVYVDDDYYAGLPDELLEADVLSAVTNWYKAGGNLLLSTLGNLYLTQTGRINLSPDILGTGTGADNPDIWYVSPTYGTWEVAPQTFNKSTDPIYAGLTSEPKERSNGQTYVIYPLIGAGWKEDHNVFWTMEIPTNVIPNDNPSKLTTFQTTYAMEALGTWAHVEDYFGCAIARWLPQGAFQGKAITIGVAAYEWKQNSGTNPYQANVERLTKNALDELKGSTSGISSLNTSNVKINLSDNVILISGENLISARIFNVNGSLAGNYNAAQISAGINVSHLASGVYLVNLQTENGQVVNAKIVK
ncbi:hypothetical protein AGMMS50262_20350 [Bacteroidia bacterium]|nr:hypothetical protein AGMMS50262_20350 [Bacteroidia bacterium]